MATAPDDYTSGRGNISAILNMQGRARRNARRSLTLLRIRRAESAEAMTAFPTLEDLAPGGHSWQRTGYVSDETEAHFLTCLGCGMEWHG